MGIRKFVSSLMLVLLVLTCIPSVFGDSEDWVEVARFTETGKGYTKTETFECSHIEWRIRWSFSSNVNAFPIIFAIDVYNSSEKIIDYFITSIPDSGTLNYNTTGSFYLGLRVSYVKNYEVIIEQNIESIPEFPSWIILPFFVLTTISVISCKNKLTKTNNEPGPTRRD